MAADDALVIDIPKTEGVSVATDDDGLPKTVVEAPAPVEEGEVPSPDLTKEVEAYKRNLETEQAARREAAEQLEAERKARAEIESKLASVTDDNYRNKWNAAQGDYQQILGGINSCKIEVESAKRDLRFVYADENLSPQDRADRVAAAQERISKATAEQVSLEAGASGAKRAIEDLERQIQAAYSEDRRPKPQTPEPKKPTADEWIGQFNSDTQRWLREHKEYVTEPRLHQKLIAFANNYLAVEEKPLYTPEFLKALDDKFFPKAEAHVDEVETPAAPKATPKPRAAAPVSRGSNYFSSTNPRGEKIHLHPFLVKQAKEMGYEPKDYALYIKKGIDEGKMPKNFLDPDYPHGDI